MVDDIFAGWGGGADGVAMAVHSVGFPQAQVSGGGPVSWLPYHLSCMIVISVFLSIGDIVTI